MSTELVRESIERLIDGALVRFANYEERFGVTWQAAMVDAKVGERSKALLRRQLGALISEFIATEEEILVATTEALIAEAGLGREKEYDDLLMERVDTTVERLHAKLQSDARRIVEAMGRVMIAAQMEAQGGNTLPESERMRAAYVMEKRRVSFGYVDRAGKHWSTGHFLRVNLMSHYYLAVNDYAVMTLKGEGEIFGRIDDPGHTWHEADLELEEYPEMGDTIFHPQSTALILV